MLSGVKERRFLKLGVQGPICLLNTQGDEGNEASPNLQGCQRRCLKSSIPMLERLEK